MTRAIVLREHGGPAVLVPEEVSVGEPGQGNILVHQSAVGRDTFAESLESLAFCGALVNYGQASGPVDPIAPAALGAKSNRLSRPVVFHYLRRRSALEAMAAELFQAVAAGVLKADIGLHLPLDRAREAHAALEARRTTGAVVLIP